MNLEQVEEAYWPPFPQRNHSAPPFNLKGQRSERTRPASLIDEVFACRCRPLDRVSNKAKQIFGGILIKALPDDKGSVLVSQRAFDTRTCGRTQPGDVSICSQGT